MATNEKEKQEIPAEETLETPETAAEEAAVPQEAPEVDPWEEKFNAEHDARLRLAAEYDNFRKRNVKEKHR